MRATEALDWWLRKKRNRKLFTHYSPETDKEDTKKIKKLLRKKKSDKLFV